MKSSSITTDAGQRGRGWSLIFHWSRPMSVWRSLAGGFASSISVYLPPSQGAGEKPPVVALRFGMQPRSILDSIFYSPLRATTGAPPAARKFFIWQQAVAPKGPSSSPRDAHSRPYGDGDTLRYLTAFRSGGRAAPIPIATVPPRTRGSS